MWGFISCISRLRKKHVLLGVYWLVYYITITKWHKKWYYHCRCLSLGQTRSWSSPFSTQQPQAETLSMSSMNILHLCNVTFTDISSEINDTNRCVNFTLVIFYFLSSKSVSLQWDFASNWFPAADSLQESCNTRGLEGELSMDYVQELDTLKNG